MVSGATDPRRCVLFGEALGGAVQVDPMRPMLKPPRTKHLKLKCDMLLSTFAFTFNLRRYTWVAWTAGAWRR